MKTRDSGMPDEDSWSSFFDPATVLRKLWFPTEGKLAVEFGCGYGTFTIPAATIFRGTLYTVDIEPEMVRLTTAKAAAAGLTNVEAAVRDFVADGTGQADASADYVMLFNILHAEEPQTLLREAWRILRVGGLLGIMHWNYDPTTPRGPSMAIRPRPEQCAAWASEAGFRQVSEQIDLPPYHYGFVFARTARPSGGLA